jgi:hypothetical protein
MDIEYPQSSSQTRYTNETGTSKNPDKLVLGTHEKSNETLKISINYTSSKNYMIVILGLSTHASQLSLLNQSLLIQIQRSLQSV